jgi:hypothetical protein
MEIMLAPLRSLCCGDGAPSASAAMASVDAAAENISCELIFGMTSFI